MTLSTKRVLSFCVLTVHLTRESRDCSISRQVIQRGCTQLPLLI